MRVKEIAILGGLCILLLTGGASWADAALQEQHARTQAQREQLQRRVQQLQRAIEHTMGQRDDVREQLRTVEAAISKRGQTLEQLATRLSATEEQLEQLEADYDAHQEQKEKLQQRLASQLRAQYASGLSPWVALLSAQDLNAVQRELHYLGYVTEAQAQRVQELNQLLAQMQQLQHQTKALRQQTMQLQAQVEREQQALHVELAQHQELLQKIETELAAQQGQAEQVQADEARLAALIQGLEAEIQAHRAAERAAQEAARRAAEQARLRAEAEARERQRQAAQQAEQARQAAAPAPAQKEREAAMRLAQQLRISEHGIREGDLAHTPAVRTQPLQPESAPSRAPEPKPPAPIVLTGLKKGAPMPAQGPIQGRFGAQRPDGGVWRGIIIRAAEGSPAYAIAPGEVVFAGWLSGFGNLLIIDHGQDYLTVYGHNQSLLKQVGEQVRPGEIVARVGATGGQVEPGLYFEIRHRGEPVNPQLWLKAS